MRVRTATIEAWVLAAAAATLSVAVSVASVAAGQELAPAERQVAAEAAYDRGTQAFTGNEFARAAHWYEVANRLAPAANAVAQAIRAHERAGNLARAATLAAAARELYGAERMARYTDVVETAGPQLVHVRVDCSACASLEVNGEPETLRTIYLTPDTEHTLVGHFARGDTERRLVGAAGSDHTMVLEPPPAPAQVSASDATPPFGAAGRSAAATADAASPIDDRPPLSPVVPLAVAGLAAVAGGLAIWSWVDTLDAADDYERAPTAEKLDAGRDLELRTELLLGSTIALGVTSAALGLFFTDWGGGSPESMTVAIAVEPDRVVTAIRGTI